MSTQVLEYNDNGVMVTTSNVTTSTTESYQSRALSILLQKEFVGPTYHLHNNHAIANSGAT